MNDPSTKTHTVIGALESLLEDQHLRAVALSGPWGVGKTYLVRQFAACRSKEFKAQELKFIYISLFGLQSLSEVRARLAAAAIEAGGEGLQPSRIKGLLHKALRRLPKEAAGFDISGAGELVSEFVENAVLKRLMVCIDDLERSGEGLRPVDVLGLISELTEQRDCKCLLVLNKDKLANDRQVQLFEEKVFDLSLDFRPSAADVIQLGISDRCAQASALPIFEAFGSANIRVMKRVDWVVGELARTKVEGLQEIWSAVTAHAALLTILKFERGLGRDAFASVLDRTETSLFIKELEKELEKGEAEASDDVTGVLDGLNYRSAEFDSCIVDLIHDGAFDSAKLNEAFKAEVTAHRAHTIRQQVNAILQETRSGFRITAVEFTRRLRGLFASDISALDRPTIAVLCDLLVAVDDSKQAVEIVSERMAPIFASVPPESRESQLKEFPCLLASGIVQRIPYVETPPDRPTLVDLFRRCAKNPDGWDPQAAPLLAKYSNAEISDMLANLEAPDAMTQIRRFRERLLQMGEFGGLGKKLSDRIDRIVEDLSNVDPLYRYKLKHFAAPRKSPPTS